MHKKFLLTTVFFGHLFLSTVTAQHTLVAIGDSNGAKKSGWVNQLKSIRADDRVINYSTSGNTIGFDNNGKQELNTLRNIDSYLSEAKEESIDGSLDAILILLGTNDCKKIFENREIEVLQNLEKLIQQILRSDVIESSKSDIYIISPPPFGEDSILLDKYKGGDQRIRQLLPGFMDVTLKYNCHFVDIYHELKPLFHKLSSDGVHLNLEGSKIVASTISKHLDNVFKIEWDNDTEMPWPAQFNIVDIPSRLDGEIQKAYYYPTSKSSPKPLIISLHTWSGDYTQKDPLIEEVLENDWNYIHPDFRGKNNSPKACGSEFAISDIDQAIKFAIAQGNVDTNSIHVIGASGGGYATLLSYMKSSYSIASYSAWVPISDIEAWYYQSVGRKNKYASDILLATNSIDSLLDISEARNRSPVFMKTPIEKRRNIPLSIYAGIHDGYTGSVPISQSLSFYNKVIAEFGAAKDDLISEQEMLDLLSMRYNPEGSDSLIGDRKIIFERKFDNISIIIFEGKHEMLTDVALKLLPVENEK